MAHAPVRRNVTVFQPTHSLAALPVPETTFLKRGAFLTPFFLGFLYLGFGWQVEVQPDRMELVCSPADLRWAGADTADLTLIREGDLVRGWIDANDGSGYSIASLLSQDEGQTWSDPKGGPVFGRTLEWARLHLTSPHVIQRNGGYEMWFSGTSDPRLAVGYQIGRAASTDGINWSVDPLPVLSTGDRQEGDHFSVADPCVLFENGKFWMWYSGADEFKGLPRFRVWQAVSEDGVHWQKRKPITGDVMVSAAPEVVRHGGTDHLFYAVANRLAEQGFQEIRYRPYKPGFGFGWFPWSGETVLTNKQLGDLAAHSLYSPAVDLDDGGNGHLYVSVHDSQGVWRIVRVPLRVRRAWYGLS